MSISHPYEQSGRRRMAVLALAVVGLSLFAVSYFLPYWHFKMVAPQYPQGLFLQIFLSGVRGDVAELDIINHYIGMHSMADAAQMERANGPYLIALIMLSGVLGMLFLGRKLHWGLLLVAIMLPLGFIGDTMYWMYQFGHHLDPSAPIDFAPFMPELFGHGQIGQFHTWAWAGSGFWTAMVGAGAVMGSVFLRERICRTCTSAEVCGATCPHHFVHPTHSPSKTGELV